MIGDRESSWLEIRAPASFRQTNYIALTFTEEGNVWGSIRNTFVGYEAVNRRRLVYSFDSYEGYKADVAKKLGDAVVTGVELTNLEDVAQPLVEVIGVEMSGFATVESNLLLNPFLFNKTVSNPFKSTERMYPVDFGAEIDERITIVLEFPEGVNLVNIPEEVGPEYFYRRELFDRIVQVQNADLIFVKG